MRDIPPVLVMDRVTAGYGETMVLDKVSFTVPAGGILALLGRNGVGKTTLLTTVMGHTRMRFGQIYFENNEITHAPVHMRSRYGIGLVPQERHIFPSLTVLENLKIASRPGRWTVDAVCDLFPCLAERRSNMGCHLSGGEQQMLAIGRALMGNPSLVLMDEPSEGLAPIIVEQLIKALYRLRDEEGLAIILVEQNSRLALRFSDVAVVLDRGRVIYDGESTALLEDSERLNRLIGVGE
ncbi:MAG: ABC transporter ATP-binding protein [Pseudorhodoplanes sp.]|nr:ABC transporter ATP-binding protein [Pseudorhodoplanes sp.]